MNLHDEDPGLTSRLANEQADHGVNADTVLAVIRSFSAETGCISDDVQEALGINERVIPYSSVTNPYSVLERAFLIERNGEMREGHRFKRMQWVMRALTPEQTEAKRAAHEAMLAGEISQENHALLAEWWDITEKMKPFVERELFLRSLIEERLFRHAPIGETILKIADGWFLRFFRKRKGFTLEYLHREPRGKKT